MLDAGFVGVFDFCQRWQVGHLTVARTDKNQGLEGGVGVITRSDFIAHAIAVAFSIPQTG